MSKNEPNLSSSDDEVFFPDTQVSQNNLTTELSNKTIGVHCSGDNPPQHYYSIS